MAFRRGDLAIPSYAWVRGFAFAADGLRGARRRVADVSALVPLHGASAAFAGRIDAHGLAHRVAWPHDGARTVGVAGHGPKSERVGVAANACRNARSASAPRCVSSSVALGTLARTIATHSSRLIAATRAARIFRARATRFLASVMACSILRHRGRRQSRPSALIFGQRERSRTARRSRVTNGHEDAGHLRTGSICAWACERVRCGSSVRPSRWPQSASRLML